jgi:phosphoesterase RecJ-like protein
MMLTDIVKRLAATDNIGIINHIAPDGDALGSSAALGLALEKMGKRVVILRNDTLPDKYRFLPGAHMAADCDNAPFVPDSLVVLDCGDIERLGKGIGFYEKASTVLNIDHHISNTMFGNLNIVDTNAAATAEIVYQVIKLLGINMDLDIATCLFTAIAADTGCFKYDNTTSITHGIAGELISMGVQSNRICNRIFELRTLPQTKLLGRAIDSLRVYHGGKTAVMVITKQMLLETGCGQEDLEGIIDYARDIEGVEVAALLRETDDGDIKVGLRSNEYTDTSEIAAAWGGGGHKKASGYTVRTTMAKATESLLERIESFYR